MTAILRNLLTLEISALAAMLALLSFLVLLKRLRGGELWVATVILVYGGTETTAYLLAFFQIHNLWLYNAMLIPQFLVLSHTLLRTLSRRRLKLMLQIGVLTLSVFHLTNLSFFQGISTFANFTFIPVCGWLAVCAFFFLRDQMEQIEKSPFDNLVTWLAIATLIDNAATMPLLTVLGWPDFNHTTYIVRLWLVVTWLYAMWYLIIVIGLLWTKTSLKSAFFSRSSH